MAPKITKTLENDIFLLFLILIPTKSGTFAHCGLVFVNKASTDGGIALLAFAFAGKLAAALASPLRTKANDGGEQQPSSPTGGHPNPAAKHPNPAAKHPNPSAEATDAAEAIIRDYGITN